MHTRQRLGAAVAPLVLATSVGLAAGVAAGYLQGALGDGFGQVANSGAAWTLVAFAAALPAARSRTSAVVGGTLALVGEVAGYYAIAAPLTGTATTRAEQLLWTLAALVFGPLAGLAAYGARDGSPVQRIVAVLVLCGVTAGEGAYLWRLVPAGRQLAAAEFAASAVVALGALCTSSAPIRWRAGAVLLAALTAGAVYVAYSDPLVF